MKETMNYKLKKPDKKEFYNIDIFNENADLIDKELYNSSKKIENLEETLINNLNEKHKNFEEKYNKNLEEQNKKIDDNSKNDSRYFRRDLGDIKDFNEAIIEGIYSVSGNILNSPSKNCFGRLIVYVRDRDITQMFITHNNKIFLRFCNNGSEWRSWNKVFSDSVKPTWEDIQSKPSEFIPAHHTHDDVYLKKSNGYVSDFNKCLTEGVYSVGSETAIPNGPANEGIYGILEVFKKKNELLQRCTNFFGQTYVRYLNYKNEWGTWNKIMSNSDFNSKIDTNCGYQKLPNGVIVQCGSTVLTFDNYTARGYLYYPIAFTKYAHCLGNIASNESRNYCEITGSVVSDNLTRGYAEARDIEGKNLNGKKVRVNWIAMGI